MSDDVKHDRAFLSVHFNFSAAERDARAINADKVRIVSLMPFNSAEAQALGISVPVGYMNVATGHRCPCCLRQVEDLE